MACSITTITRCSVAVVAGFCADYYLAVTAVRAAVFSVGHRLQEAVPACFHFAATAATIAALRVTVVTFFSAANQAVATNYCNVARATGITSSFDTVIRTTVAGFAYDGIEKLIATTRCGAVAIASGRDTACVTRFTAGLNVVTTGCDANAWFSGTSPANFGKTQRRTAITAGCVAVIARFIAEEEAVPAVDRAAHLFGTIRWQGDAEILNNRLKT